MPDFDLSEELIRARTNDADARALMYRIELRYLERIIDSIGLSVGEVLDIGCGDGAFLSLLQERGWKAFGVEVRDDAKSVAENRGIIFNDYKYSGGFFDLIVMRGVIHHIENIEDVFKITYKLLREGGLLAILATPNAESLCYWLFKEMPMLVGGHHRTPIFKVWMKKELIDYIEQVGFRIIATRSPYLGTPYAQPIKDMCSFIIRLLGRPKVFPFWGNMMEIYAKK